MVTMLNGGFNNNGYYPENEFCRPTGGVAVISNEGKVYTEGGDNDALNVSVTGSSDHWADDELHSRTGLGVDLPYDDGKAAIMISSAEDLKLGTGTQLNAYGRYYDEVDDRPAIDFLVDVSSSVSISSCEPVEYPDGPVLMVMPQYPEYELVPKGTMVVDAYDSVTFGDLFEESLAGDDVDSDVGDRLEVVSRITEWLFRSIGRLPYPDGGGPFAPGYNYVLRGAGLENPGITDGRAWVLEDPTEWTPFGEEFIPEVEETAFEEERLPCFDGVADEGNWHSGRDYSGLSGIRFHLFYGYTAVRGV